MPEAAIQVGTSGWNYQHWRWIFYPPDLPPREWLRFYARSFRTVEVNYSFYRLPTFEAFANWAAQTPPDFTFSAKASRFVTHLKRLRDADVHVPKFFERANALGAKLG